MGDIVLDRLQSDYYTTEQVAAAVGRKPEHWCRIRHRYIAKYGLQAIRVGRRHYYSKKSVKKMMDDLLAQGD
jgi:predicted urease superfamily metal-dependent hydrolase